MEAHAERARPANAMPMRGLRRMPHMARRTDASHAHPAIHPHSAMRVRWEPTRVRISGMRSGSRYAEASAPELPRPTPSGFAANSLRPESQMSGRFRIEPSSERRGHIRQSAMAATDTATGSRRRKDSAMRRRGASSGADGRRTSRLLHAESSLHATHSRAATRMPVRDCVSRIAAKSAAERPRPAHAMRRQPQHRGRSAHASAAAWFGLPKPKEYLKMASIIIRFEQAIGQPFTSV